MRHLRTVLSVLLTILLWGGGTMASEGRPVVLLIQARGDVACSPDGRQWREVLRNKFLYEGDRVKTGPAGYCKLIDQQTEMIQTIGNRMEVEIHKDGTRAIQGDIAEARPAGSFISFLKRKFARVQKYTVLRRRGKPKDKIRLRTAREICLSDIYPDLVWENAGPEYTYQLTVGQKVLDIPPARGDLVRCTLAPMTPGRFAYRVRVLYKGEVVYTPERENHLHWLSETEKNAFLEKEQRVREIDPDNGFLLGNFMDEQGFKVAALDQYRRFLTENPEMNEVRPFLIKVCNDLRLDRLRQTEAVRYHQNADSEN